MSTIRNSRLPMIPAAIAGGLAMLAFAIARQPQRTIVREAAAPPGTVHVALSGRHTRLGFFGRGMIILGLLLVLAFLSTFLLLGQRNVFQSPDETSNRIFTEAFGSTGKLWYEDPLLAGDDENLLHPRGVVTHDDRAVPFNFLGLPVMYGPIEALIGSNVKYVAIIFSAITVASLYAAARTMFKARPEDILVTIIGCTPLLYYFNRPFMSALPAMAMLSVGIWLLTCFWNRERFVFLYFAAVAFALSMAFRYELVLFLPVLLGIVLLEKVDTVAARRFIVPMSVSASITVVVFVGPVLALNEYVYGDWHTYGYSLFNQVYYPRSAGDTSSLMGLFAPIRNMLVPSTIDLSVVSKNLLRFMVVQVPVFGVLSLVGGWYMLRERRVTPRCLMVGIPLLAYFIVYRGSSETWASRGMYPSFDAAIMRYWLPLYLGMFFLAVFALNRVTDPLLRGILMGAVAISGTLSLGWQYDGNLSGIRTTLAREQAWSEEVLVPSTEESAVVYSGRSDKRIVPYRFNAAWWNGSEFYDPDKIARSMSKVIAAGRPVYLVREREVDIDRLNESLAHFGLIAVATENRPLYRIEAVSLRGKLREP